MSTAISLSTAARNGMLNDLGPRVNGGTIEIRTGAKPASPDDAATGTLLATFTLPSPAFTAASGGFIDLDADPILTATTVAAGTAGYGRMKSSGGTAVMDGDAGLTDAVFLLSTVDLVSGDDLELTLGAISL